MYIYFKLFTYHIPVGYKFERYTENIPEEDLTNKLLTNITSFYNKHEDKKRICIEIYKDFVNEKNLVYKNGKIINKKLIKEN